MISQLKQLKALSGLMGKEMTLPQVLALVRDEFGVNVDVRQIPMEKKPAAEQIDAIAEAACRPGAEFFQVNAEYQGKPIRVFMVLGAQ